MTIHPFFCVSWLSELRAHTLLEQDTFGEPWESDGIKSTMIEISSAPGPRFFKAMAV